MAKDLFSLQTSSYAKYRPTYPADLYEHIISFVKCRDMVWDCGTGNGQAARALAGYFQKVMATDISEKQLAMAKPNPKIEYIVSPAEYTPFADNSFDLVTIAQAYHWFDFNLFEEEVRRVGKAGGIIAIWGYSLINTPNQHVNRAISGFYSDVIGPYWDAERRYVEENYDTIPFDFPILSSRLFSIESNWLKADFSGYLNSWSAVQNFIMAKNYNPVIRFTETLDEILKDDQLTPVSFPVFLKLGLIK